MITIVKGNKKHTRYGCEVFFNRAEVILLVFKLSKYIDESLYSVSVKEFMPMKERWPLKSIANTVAYNIINL